MNGRHEGMTLLELVLVLALFALLAGVVYAAMGGVREQGRRAACASNLRQIGVAIALYRQDYGRAEFGSPVAMGLPPTPLALHNARPGGRGSYVSTIGLFHCRNVAADTGDGLFRNHPERMCHYAWGVWSPALTQGYPQVPDWAATVRRRGGDFPIMEDEWHARARLDRPPGLTPRFVIVLRLDGRVTMGTARWGAPGWEW